MNPLAAQAVVFGRSVWLQYVALFQWATILGYAAYKVVLPIGQILFFVEFGVYATGPQNALYFALGNALQMTANAGIYGVIGTVANERHMGTLPILLGSPANRLVTFLSRAIVNVIDGVITVLFGLILTAVLFHLDIARGNLPLLGLCVVVISLSTAGLGLLFGSIGLIMRFCGINFPVTQLPGAAQVVAYALPLTRGIEAAREAADGASVGHVAGLLAGEIVVGVVYAFLGYLLFRAFEAYARRGGLQDAY